MRATGPVAMRYLVPAFLLALPGCAALGGPPPLPEAPDQDAFAYADVGPFEEAPADAASPWWQAFDDPLLTALVQDARAANLDLRVALRRAEAAQARTRAARRGLLPQGGTSLAVQRQQNAAAAFAAFAGPDAVGDGPPEQPTFDLYTASADLSWEIDLFGRLRAETGRARADAAAQAALARDTQRLVTARTAEAYVALLEAAARASVAERNLAAQARALRLTEQLVEMGELAAFDLLRQQTLTRVTEAGLEQARAARAEAVTALALLTGRTVPALIAEVPGVAAPPPLPRPGDTIALADPARVLARRPDVAQAEAQLLSVAYGRRAQSASLFPQVTVTGSASLTALDFSGLSDDGAFGFAYGPRLSWPVFSYPQLLARLDASGREVEAAALAYERAALAALTETDAALAVYARSLRRARLLEAAQETATRGLTLADVRYREGADSLLSFLDAQRTALETEDAFVTARASALRARIGVHRALGD